jgi:hypothetical protein
LFIFQILEEKIIILGTHKFVYLANKTFRGLENLKLGDFASFGRKEKPNFDSRIIFQRARNTFLFNSILTNFSLSSQPAKSQLAIFDSIFKKTV